MLEFSSGDERECVGFHFCLGANVLMALLPTLATCFRGALVATAMHSSGNKALVPSTFSESFQCSKTLSSCARRTDIFNFRYDKSSVSFHC